MKKCWHPGPNTFTLVDCTTLNKAFVHLHRRSNRPYPLLVRFLAAADVNPFARLVRSALELEVIRGEEPVVVERGRDDLIATGINSWADDEEGRN